MDLTAISPQARLTARKTWRIMKITTVLILAAALHVGAKGLAQRVTLSVKDAPLKTVFIELNKQTGYNFLYSDEVLANSGKVTISVKNEALENVLKLCFSNQPLEYVIENNAIIIKSKTANPSGTDRSPAPQRDLTGLVSEDNGRPMEGVSIVVRRSGKGTITDTRGAFILKGLDEADVLEFSYVGYEKLSVPIKDQPSLHVTMKIAINDLDKVVIQAYGKTTQRVSTGNIVRITSDEIQRQPVFNSLMALQGKVPGLNVTSTSGFASGPVKVELRGRSALSNSFTSDPLYIVDGVPLTFVGIGEGFGIYQYGSPGFIQNGMGGPSGGQSPLANINPADIESIEVLKDADATAIYGSRGANGVVLITTKTGKAEKTRFAIDVQEGVTHLSRFYKFLNTQQYVAMRNEALRNDGVPVDPVADYDINGDWDTTRYTDWQKTLIGKTGNSLNANLSISGGNSQTTFRIGGGYNRVTDVTAISGANQRADVSTNIQHRSVNQKFRLALSSTYSSSKANMIYIPNISTFAPDAPSIYDSTGKLNWAGWGGVNNNTDARGQFPFYILLQPFTSESQFLNAALAMNYNITRKIQASVNIGYNSAQSTQNYVQSIASQDPNQNPKGNVTWGTNDNKNWIVEPQLNYNTFIGKGKLDVLAGGSAQQTNTEGVIIFGTNFTNDNLLGSLTNAPSVRTNQSSGEFKYAGAFGRITYNWKDKYILNLNGRRDGSSRFGSGKQYGNFGSLGAAWIFTEENWFKKHLPVLSFGKIRGSYGTTGSDAVGDYKYLSQYTSAGTFPYGGITPLRPIVEGNPDYHWQVNKKFELAFNGGLFSDRINFQVAYYRDRCGNQLIDYPLPLLTGFSSVTANSVAEVENYGWEYSALFKIIDTKNISWSINFNLASNKNKLLSYPNLELSPFLGTYVVGQPLNLQRLVHYTGVDPLTGYYTFEDKNHDGQITKDYSTLKSDDTYPVDLSPKYFGGFGSDLSFKGFQLNLFFSFKKQIAGNAYLGSNLPGSVNSNVPVELLDRWQQPGDNKPYALFVTNSFGGSTNSFYNFYSNSDGVYTDASFLRLSNVSLAYALPATLLKGKGLNGGSIFIHANNLFVITKYKGLDPETTSYSAYPPTKTIVVGLSVHF